MNPTLVAINPEEHNVEINLVYASPDNISGRAIYKRPLCLLHRDAEMALRKAVTNAGNMGYKIKIFDAFRPQEAQEMLWESLSDSSYIADPQQGSNHTRGTALDITLVDSEGRDLDMGTSFDDMSPLSHHFSDQVPPKAQANRLLLLNIMEEAGFEHIAHEWWHYALPENEAHALIQSGQLAELNPMHQ